MLMYRLATRNRGERDQVRGTDKQREALKERKRERSVRDVFTLKNSPGV